uniref:NurA domain-containing protein n=1 Tax=Dictyoglomus thermophilum TaxID=14 RepID=A0A7V4DYH3_DICTH
MPNPLKEINPVLNLLGSEIKILPAIGGAVEELQHADEEEVEDKIINKKDIIETFAETPEPKPNNLYRKTPPLSRKEKHMFRFFIDGSLKTYFLGTGIEGTRSFPIELAQIGSAVIRREDDGTLKVHERRLKIILLLPKKNQGVSDTVWEELRKIEKPNFFEVVDFTLPDPLADTKSDPRDKAGAKARSSMHKLEIELIKSTDPYRNENSWLILDGSIKFVEEDIWNTWKNNPNVVGIAKSFRKDLIFQIDRRLKKRIDITTLLAGLPYGHRTVAFGAFEGQVAFWYVRIREQKEVDYPLMGVIKVEYPCLDRNPIPSELADLISSALIAERNVTPYGLDRRWHCSLYPIYVAEQVIKNSFFSKEVLMGCIKFPKPKIGGEL